MQAQRLKTKRTFKALKDVYSAGNDICQQLNDDTRDIFKTLDRYRSACSLIREHALSTHFKIISPSENIHIDIYSTKQGQGASRNVVLASLFAKVCRHN